MNHPFPIPPPITAPAEHLPELSRDEMRQIVLLARMAKAGSCRFRVELHQKKGTLRIVKEETYDCAA